MLRAKDVDQQIQCEIFNFIALCRFVGSTTIHTICKLPICICRPIQFISEKLLHLCLSILGPIFSKLCLI